MSPISLRLEEFRTAKGLSQAELARRSGVAQSTISRLESGKSNGLDLANLEKLANALEVDASLLIRHTQRPK